MQSQIEGVDTLVDSRMCEERESNQIGDELQDMRIIELVQDGVTTVIENPFQGECSTEEGHCLKLHIMMLASLTTLFLYFLFWILVVRHKKYKNAQICLYRFMLSSPSLRHF